MEERAQVWNEFARKNNIKIEGFYNANIVSFEIKNRNLKFFGIRQNSNVGTILFGMNHISEELTVTYETPINLKSKHIQVRESTLWNILRRKLKNKHIYNTYFVTYNDENAFQELKNIGVFDFEKLKKLAINKKGIKLVLHELPENTAIIQAFLDYCKVLK